MRGGLSAYPVWGRAMRRESSILYLGASSHRKSGATHRLCEACCSGSCCGPLRVQSFRSTEAAMLRMECIRDAVEGVTAALLGKGWEEALHRFAYASGAHGAVLMRTRANRMLASSTREEVAEPVAAFAAGRAPPNSRYRMVMVGPRFGFRVDHDDYNQDQLNRDPFYREDRHGAASRARRLSGTSAAVSLRAP